jgi:hypothetical protein
MKNMIGSDQAWSRSPLFYTLEFLQMKRGRQSQRHNIISCEQMSCGKECIQNKKEHKIK